MYALFFSCNSIVKINSVVLDLVYSSTWWVCNTSKSDCWKRCFK